MLTLYKILSLALVLGIIVLVHELGHFIAARLMKVRVETFSFGFGKRLFGKKFGETDIRLSLIPLGGYVKMSGEEDYEAKNPKPYEFQAKNRAQKVFILIMGPAMNFILAFFILTIINIGGVEVARYKSEPPVIGYVEKDSPAKKAGLKSGDLILSIAGEKIPDWQNLELTLGSNPNENLAVRYERAGKVEQVVLRVGVMTRENLNPAGIYWRYKTVIRSVEKGKPADAGGMKTGDIVLKINGEDVSFFEVKDMIMGSPGEPLTFLVQRGDELVHLKIIPEMAGEEVKIGIGLNIYTPTTMENFGLFRAVGRSFEEMVRMTVMTVSAIKKLITGKINPKHVSSLIDIAEVSQEAFKSGMPNFFLLIAFLSLHIGLLNLLPIPVLDGGHLLIYTIESIIRRDISAKLKIVLMNIGFFLLVALMALAILNDIAKRLPNGWNSFLPF
jgi:regulator of sigma E protease